MALSTLFVGPIERGLNACLAAAPGSRARLAPLAGRIIDVELVELGLRLRFMPDIELVHVDIPDASPPDVSIRGTLVGMAAATLGPAETAMRGVEATGDMDVAQDFTRLLREADVDWEELLAGKIGDVAAHQLGRFGRGLAGWSRQAGDHLVRDLGEYLSEEAALVPARAELDDFLRSIDRLRDDVERIGARVTRLRRQLGPAG